MTTEYSIQKMVSDGTLSTIALGIQYLQRNDIYMRIAGEETPQSGAPSGYTWYFVDNTTLKILPVVPNGVEVVVYRRTDVDAMYNIYSQNAQFDEATIDENNQQLLYIAQEYLEQGIPGAGVDTIEFLRDDGTNTYYRIKRTDGSYSNEFSVPSAGSVTKIVAREALRRSYAEAGYNLVDGSFEVGGTLVNANDVLLHEASGKAFSGPAGDVAADTDPASGGFVDYSDQIAGKRSFRSFGAIGDAVADDYAALQAAIDWAGSRSGRCVYGHAGDKHKISRGLVLRFDNKPNNPDSTAILDFTGTELIPTTSGITALKVSRNFATVINPTVRTYTADGMGVTAYALAPEDEEQTTQRVWQMYCTFKNPVAQNCAVGFRFKPGPTVDGQNSGAFYHTIDQPRFRVVDVGFYFQRSVSGDNLNTRIFINNPIHVHGHCMFDMEAVDSLVVTGGSAEFINRAGKHTGNPTIKVHKPVSADSLSTSNCAFYSFYGEAGTTPYDFMTTQSIALVNCTFFGYTNGGVNNTYALNNQFTNEGAVVSRAKYSSSTTPTLAVRREYGPNIGQAFLHYRNLSAYPAEFYADRGFTFSSDIHVARIKDLQNISTNSQIIGSSFAKIDITGSEATGTVKLFNTSSLSGKGFEFGGCDYIGPDNDNAIAAGKYNKRYSVVYAGTGAINTSDAREKTAPNPISDDVLDAWGEVSHVTFKWLDAVAKKGDLARTHFGVIAQDVRDAFERHGLDGTQFGLLCYDAWDDEYEPIFEEREVTETVPDPDSPDGTRTITTTKEVQTGESRLVRAAGDRWGIRSDQCLFLEAAYQRRRCDRIEARLSAAGL